MPCYQSFAGLAGFAEMVVYFLYVALVSASEAQANVWPQSLPQMVKLND
jgi:hypothetical protein